MESRGKKPRKGFLIKCTECGSEAYRSPSRIIDSRGHEIKKFFCSRDCKKKHSVVRKKMKCVECDKYFNYYQTQYRSERQFCSNNCKGIFYKKQLKGYMGIKIDSRDNLFSKMIRERDNWTCQFCNTKYEPGSRGLQNSHFWGRGDKIHRFDPKNCDALCAGCHFRHEGNKQGFYRDWKIKQLGEELYNKMEKDHYQKTKKYGKFEKDALIKILREQYKNEEHLKPDWKVIW